MVTLWASNLVLSPGHKVLSLMNPVELVTLHQGHQVSCIIAQLELQLQGESGHHIQPPGCTITDFWLKSDLLVPLATKLSCMTLLEQLYLYRYNILIKFALLLCIACVHALRLISWADCYVSNVVQIQILSAVNPTVHINLVLCHADLRTFHTAYTKALNPKFGWSTTCPKWQPLEHKRQ